MSLYFSVLSELDVTFLETALLAFPEFENEALTLDVIKPYWEVLEDLFHKEVILSLGIADLDKNLLEELFDWAVVSSEKHTYSKCSKVSNTFLFVFSNTGNSVLSSHSKKRKQRS